MTDPLQGSGTWRIQTDPSVPVISDRTQVPLGVVWTVVAAVVVLAFAAGAAHYRLGEQAAEVAKLRDRSEAQEVRAATSDANYLHIISALDRMQQQLDRIERRSARVARDDPP